MYVMNLLNLDHVISGKLGSFMTKGQGNVNHLVTVAVKAMETDLQHRQNVNRYVLNMKNQYLVIIKVKYLNLCFCTIMEYFTKWEINRNMSFTCRNW